MDGDGLGDACDEDPVPVVSGWGILIMLLLLLTASVFVLGRRRPTSA